MKINFDKKISPRTVIWTFGIVLVAVLLSFFLFYPALTPRPLQENINTSPSPNVLSQTEEQSQGDCIDCKCDADDWFENCCNNCEKTFDKPIDVVWTGNVFAYMSSGANLAIERVPENKEYPLFSACCIDTVKENGDWIIPPETWITGKVKVTGKWLGITCTYVNTIFGRCVPDVDIEKIEEIKPYTPVVYLNNLKWWTAKISEENLRADVNVEYPQFIGGNEVKDLNSHIRRIVTDVLSRDRNDVRELIEDPSIDCNASDGTTKLFCSVRLSSSYKVISAFNDIVSVELELIDYTGGGNGNHSRIRTINWDLTKNSLLDDKDIFCSKEYPDDFALLVAHGLMDSESNAYWYPTEDAFVAKKNDIEEVLQSDDPPAMSLGYREVFVIFQPYSIGSGAEGIIRSKIPYSYLKGKICL